MEHQVIDIEDRNGEDNKTAESQPDGASSSQVERIKQASSVLGKKETYSSPAREASEIQETTESQQEESALADKTNEEMRERGERRVDNLRNSLNLIESQLEQRSHQRLTRTELSSSSKCIFKLPNSLLGLWINSYKVGYPEMVSIGPYHRGKGHLLNFEDHKWFFLERVLSRTREIGRDLSSYLERMKGLEERTRMCYSDDVTIKMDSHNFTEMMLLDGLFVIELFHHLGSRESVNHVNHSIFFSRPGLIPIVLRDLLKLENQLPFDVLKSLYYYSKTDGDPDACELETLALQVFNLAFQRSAKSLECAKSKLIKRKLRNGIEIKHLLDLFYLSILPKNSVPYSPDLEKYRLSVTRIQSVSELRSSGIRFKTKMADSFLDIDLKNHVLSIPTLTVNDFTSTVLLNCIAWEHRYEGCPFRYFTDYVLFMSCLLKKPSDVALLCLDGIIATFSQDDIYVANLFSSPAKSLAFNTQVSYLSKQFRDLEAYVNSDWATMRRTYFSSPWSVISVSSAALVIALTVIQTVMAVLSYLKGTC